MSPSTDKLASWRDSAETSLPVAGFGIDRVAVAPATTVLA
jgi:hypothetical protein